MSKLYLHLYIIQKKLKKINTLNLFNFKFKDKLILRVFILKLGFKKFKYMR